MKPLHNRVALVTGATGVIGREIAISLARQGCRLVVNGIDSPDIFEALQCQLIENGAISVEVNQDDLMDANACASLVKMMNNTLGSLDILVNNAGIQHVAPIEQFGDEYWDRVIALNLSTPFRLTRHALPLMRTCAWGRIINIASVHGLVSSVNKSAYVAAKHGLIGLTKTTALETASAPITCNAVCPGYVRTPLIENQIETFAEQQNVGMDEAAVAFLRDKQPSGDYVQAADIGAMVVFLCSPAGNQITGSTFTIDGGWTAQ